MNARFDLILPLLVQNLLACISLVFVFCALICLHESSAEPGRSHWSAHKSPQNPTAAGKFQPGAARFCAPLRTYCDACGVAVRSVIRLLFVMADFCIGD